MSLICSISQDNQKRKRLGLKDLTYNNLYKRYNRHGDAVGYILATCAPGSVISYLAFYTEGQDPYVVTESHLQEDQFELADITITIKNR